MFGIFKLLKLLIMSRVANVTLNPNDILIISVAYNTPHDMAHQLMSALQIFFKDCKRKPSIWILKDNVGLAQLTEEELKKAGYVKQIKPILEKEETVE